MIFNELKLKDKSMTSFLRINLKLNDLLCPFSINLAAHR
jgi:hypothetical protein